MGQTGPTAVLSLAATETKGQSFRRCPVLSPCAGVDWQPSLTQEQSAAGEGIGPWEEALLHPPQSCYIDHPL